MSLWNALQYLTSAINYKVCEIQNSEKVAVASKQAVNDTSLCVSIRMLYIVFMLTLTQP